MGNENGIERANVFVNGSQALADLAAAQTGIDEKTSPVRRDERRVTGATRREDADLNDGGPPASALCAAFLQPRTTGKPCALHLYSSDLREESNKKFANCFGRAVF